MNNGLNKAPQGCQSQPKSYDEEREDPKATIVRLETRVRMIEEENGLLSELVGRRSREIENRATIQHHLEETRSEFCQMLRMGREVLNVNTVGAAQLINVLSLRQDASIATVERLVAFMSLSAVQPEVIRAHSFMNQGQLEDVATCAEVVRLALRILHGILKGSGEGAPELPLDPNTVDNWLGNLKAKVSKSVTRYYCPECKRHVAPEDVARMPAAGEVALYHTRESGGCGAWVKEVDENGEEKKDAKLSFPQWWEMLKTYAASIDQNGYVSGEAIDAGEGWIAYYNEGMSPEDALNSDMREG